MPSNKNSNCLQSADIQLAGRLKLKWRYWKQYQDGGAELISAWERFEAGPAQPKTKQKVWARFGRYISKAQRETENAAGGRKQLEPVEPLIPENEPQIPEPEPLIPQVETWSKLQKPSAQQVTRSPPPVGGLRCTEKITKKKKKSDKKKPELRPFQKQLRDYKKMMNGSIFLKEPGNGGPPAERREKNRRDMENYYARQNAELFQEYQRLLKPNKKVKQHFL